MYPVLSYILGKLPALKKRSYVARYLLPMEVPPEFLAHEALAETLSQYRSLQSEFKETHKAYEKNMSAMMGPGASRAAPAFPPADSLVTRVMSICASRSTRGAAFQGALSVVP